MPKRNVTASSKVLRHYGILVRHSQKLYYRNYILLWTHCPHKLMFGEITAKNGQKLSDVQLISGSPF